MVFRKPNVPLGVQEITGNSNKDIDQQRQQATVDIWFCYGKGFHFVYAGPCVVDAHIHHVHQYVAANERSEKNEVIIK